MLGDDPGAGSMQSSPPGAPSFCGRSSPWLAATSFPSSKLFLCHPHVTLSFARVFGAQLVIQELPAPMLKFPNLTTSADVFQMKITSPASRNQDLVSPGCHYSAQHTMLSKPLCKCGTVSLITLQLVNSSVVFTASVSK